jgi:hypothetical protein
MYKAKLVLGVVAAVFVAGLGGWFWGISGTRVVDRALQASMLRSALLEARSSVLDARLELYSVNFGDASRHLEDARAQLHGAEARFKSLGRQEDLKRLEPAFAVIDEAQRLAGQLDQGANARAAAAAKIIDDVLGTEGKRQAREARGNRGDL